MRCKWGGLANHSMLVFHELIVWWQRLQSRVDEEEEIASLVRPALAVGSVCDMDSNIHGIAGFWNGYQFCSCLGRTPALFPHLAGIILITRQPDEVDLAWNHSVRNIKKKAVAEWAINSFMHLADQHLPYRGRGMHLDSHDLMTKRRRKADWLGLVWGKVWEKVKRKVTWWREEEFALACKNVIPLHEDVQWDRCRRQSQRRWHAALARRFLITVGEWGEEGKETILIPYPPTHPHPHISTSTHHANNTCAQMSGLSRWSVRVVFNSALILAALNMEVWYGNTHTKVRTLFCHFILTTSTTPLWPFWIWSC